LKHFTTKRLVISSLFAALTCACTMAVHIPTPTGGYVHAGDSFLLLASFYLGPVTGGLAGAVGSMLSDMFLGYYAYAPATLIIKFLAGVTFGATYRYLFRFVNNNRQKSFFFGLSGIVPTLIIAAGYFFYEWLLTANTFAAAFSGILGNAFQGAASIILSTVFFHFVPRNVLESFI